MSKCSIVLITYNRLDYTKVTLNSILENTDYPYELIVIDNASSDGTQEYLNGFKDKIHKLILNHENLGWAKAMNQGFKLATGFYFCTSDNDMLYPKGWLAKLVDLLKNIPQLGIVSAANHAWQFEQNNYKPNIQKINGRELIITQANVPGGNMLFTKDLFKKIGGFTTREGQLMGDEDMLYCQAAQKLGFLLAYPARWYAEHIDHPNHPLSKRHKEYINYTTEVLSSKGFDEESEIKGETNWKEGESWGNWARKRKSSSLLAKIFRRK